jgi:diamine N-acetyltransferase
MENSFYKTVDADFYLDRIKVEEAAQLSVLCREIYAQYYLYLWYDGGEWYQQMRYSPAALSEELSDLGTAFYWIIQDGQTAGYFKINTNSWPKEVGSPTGKQAMEIERIYLYKEFAGRGLGRKTLEWIEALAQQQKLDCLYLYTMDSSPARRFYERMGYQNRAEKRLPFEKMKPEYRGMYLMIKELL